MAKIKDGYMGAINGKLGPAIGYMWKGRACLRSRQTNPNNPRSKKQQQCRKVFGTTASLAANMKAAMDIGLRSIAAEQQTCAFNVFISLNRQCISVEDDIVNIDYAALRVSDGKLAPVAFDEVAREGGLQVGVNYSLTDLGGTYNDYVYLFAYAPALKQSRLSMPAARGGGHVSLTLPASLAGHEVHFYGFVWNHLRDASPSTYLGKLTLTQ